MPAGNTYTQIASTTLGSAAASVTFSSIAGTYTDLILIVAGKDVTSYAGAQLQFNGDTGNNYSQTILYGDGAAAQSIRGSNVAQMNIGLASNTGMPNNIFQIMNYANSTTYKTALGRGNVTDQTLRIGVGLWRNTAAITSVTALVAGDQWATGATFSLYGITAA
jgi:hypothetical protein